MANSNSSRGGFWSAALLTMALMSLAGCGHKAMRPVPAAQLPLFRDDASFSSLETAVSQSLNYLRKLPPDRTFNYCGGSYSAAWLVESMQDLLVIVKSDPTAESLTRQISEKFKVCRASGTDGAGRMLVTGYFTPLFEASLEKVDPFVYPLYRPPDDLIKLEPDSAGRKRVGRLQNGRLIPYWSRAEIEEKGLLAGYELVYLAEPIEAFLLHVQGSGQLRLRDGSIRRVQYAGTNGRSYRSIGKLLVDSGKLDLAETDLPRIRQYLTDHPQEREDILHHNESYIFFKWGEDGRWPVGSLGEPLTGGRSIALDQDCFPAGVLCFINSAKPVVDDDGQVTGWEPLSRFVLAQDSGSAIKGPGRLDFFWGGDPYAGIAAGVMKGDGELYFLVKRKVEGRRLKAEGRDSRFSGKR